jgi:Ca-activated chloride channel family protein
MFRRPERTRLARAGAALALAALVSGCAAAAVGGILAGGAVVAERLSLRAKLTHGALLQNGPGDVGLVVGIDALELQGPRPPLNASIVLDRSGSMSGVKIQHAIAAAKAFVRGLRDGDRIAIVTYSSDVELLLPSVRVNEETQMHALRLLDGVRVSGMTNLSGGLVLGRDQVTGHAGRGRVNRVVLISDGVANVGVTTPGGLARIAEDMRERGVSVTTMGVGLDFNEDVMMRIADRGGGNYYYVRDAHRLAGVFQTELQSLSGVVAHKPELVVRLSEGVRVRNVPGYTYEQRGTEVHVRLSDLAGGSKRKVVLNLDVPTKAEGPRPVADVTLAFESVAKKTRAELRANVAATITRDAAMAARAVDRAAMSAATQAEAAHVMKQAVERYERGDVAGATADISRTQEMIRARAKRYQFNDGLIQGQMSRAATGMRAAPAPAESPGVHLRKKIKMEAEILAR